MSVHCSFTGASSSSHGDRQRMVVNKISCRYPLSAPLLSWQADRTGKESRPDADCIRAVDVLSGRFCRPRQEWKKPAFSRLQNAVLGRQNKKIGRQVNRPINVACLNKKDILNLAYLIKKILNQYIFGAHRK